MSTPERKKISIPTYLIGKPEPLPLFFEKRPYQGASGRVYPIPYVPNITDEKRDVDYDAYVLENDYIKVVLLPELGGKIHSAYDKTEDYDFIYNNKVIKPAMVGLAGPWVAGGIEFNWPQHHRPTTFMPVDAASNGKAVFMGEVDYFHQMKGMVAVSVDDDSSYIKADITVYNSTAVPHPFMWWANLAVEVNNDYKVVFPPDVEYVNDHDRRAVLEWPVARGVYKTARPFNYGEGTDIHGFDAINVPSSFMISRGQSDYDFVSGYDAKREAGIVTLANHRIAPGKKLWTWGAGEFGAKWCSNLTDDGSKYVELMTGCYTDNQPDFTMIAPYETKTFTQYWYPIKKIGEPKNATLDGALNLEATEGGVKLGFYATKKRSGCKVALILDREVLFTDEFDVSPESAYVKEISLDGIDKSELMMVVTDAEGYEILSYKAPKRGQKTPIEPRLPALPPKDIKTVEELYLNGYHLLQYKHFAYRAEDYFEEALRRDPEDSRTNKAMGDLALMRGQWELAISYYDTAIKRLTIRNCNPYDTEAHYGRALAKFRLGDLDGAYEDAYAAIWSYPQRSAGYYLLAKLEAKAGKIAEAIEFLNLSLKTNVDNLFARYALGLLTENENIVSEITKIDPLFFAGLDTEKNAIHIAIELLDFALTDKAKAILSACRDGAMKFYYLAYAEKLEGNEKAAAEYVSAADACAWECEFPARNESIGVLLCANSPMANYYLGCIYYNFERHADAAKAWENTVASIAFAPAYRNLSLAYFDHLGQPSKARECLAKAHELYPESDRIFFELTQLDRSLNLPAAERLARYENNEALTSKRDDCTLAYSVLCTVRGDYKKATDILNAHRFHTYEGGEGNLTQHHTWLKYLIARELIANGEYEKAKEELYAGLVFPENYGEEKNYFVNEAPIYLSIAECEEALGNKDNAAYALTMCDVTKGAPTVHTYFQCLALNRVGKTERAIALANELYSIGETKIRNAAVNDYYGVGSPAYPPFGYDIVKAHTLSGKILCAFGALALGKKDEAKALAADIEALDASVFELCLLKKLLGVS